MYYGKKDIRQNELAYTKHLLACRMLILLNMHPLYLDAKSAITLLLSNFVYLPQDLNTLQIFF